MRWILQITFVITFFSNLKCNLHVIVLLLSHTSNNFRWMLLWKWYGMFVLSGSKMEKKNDFDILNIVDNWDWKEMTSFDNFMKMHDTSCACSSRISYITWKKLQCSPFSLSTKTWQMQNIHKVSVAVSLCTLNDRKIWLDSVQC